MKIVPDEKPPVTFIPFSIVIETLEEAQRFYHLLNLSNAQVRELGKNSRVPNPDIGQYPLWNRYDEYLKSRGYI